MSAKLGLVCRSIALGWAAAIICAPHTAAAGDWPQWRGPRGDGVADDAPLPSEWSASRNVRWKTAIEGQGSSSPIVVGNRVFVTTAHDWGTRRVVVCLDRQNGRIMWQRGVDDDDPEVSSSLTGHAAATPASDGRRVVAVFGRAGVVCYDLDGDLLWRVALGRFESELGLASSPVIAGGAVLLVCDHDGDRHPTFDSYVTALDIKTGRTIWKTPRPKLFRSWSTPLVVRDADRRVGQSAAPPQHEATSGEAQAQSNAEGASTADKNVRPTDVAVEVRPTDRGSAPETAFTNPKSKIQNPKSLAPHLVVSAQDEVRGYDLKTGEQRWTVRGNTGWVAPSPIFAHGLIFATSGRAGPVMAIRPFGAGDVSDTHVVWQHATGGPYVPSPLVYGDYLYVHDEAGVLVCYEARTGRRVYQQRLAGKFMASALAGDGKVFFTSEDGVTHVVSAEPRFTLLASNALGEAVLATPAAAGGELFVRTSEHVFCIGGER